MLYNKLALKNVKMEKNMKFQILVDSCSDLKSNYIEDKNIGFKIIPLTINVGEKEYIDNDTIDTKSMLEDMKKSKKSSSACPAPQSFLDEFKNADYTFVVTITSKLSGCYNSAIVAKNSYEKSENIHVIDSKAVSGTEILIVDKLKELIEKGLSFEEIKQEIDKYRDERELFFILQKFDNLVNNGRMSRFAGLIASTLVIRPICVADNGEIKIAKKTIGIKNAISKMIQMIGEKGKDIENSTIIITHCFANEEVNQIKIELEKRYKFKEIRILETKGICSFYALEKGFIVCI